VSALAAACVALAGAAAADTASVAVRLGVRATGTRVVIDTAGEVSAEAATPASRRLVFTLEGLFVIQPLHGDGAGLVKDWWLEAGEGGARLTLDLTGDAAVKNRFAIPPGHGVALYRYVIDLSDGGAAPSPSVPVSDPALAPRAAPGPDRIARVHSTPPSRSRERFAAREVVVIDAGHGGHDPGAQSSDASEKDLTLAAALALRNRLERSGRYRVVMTRQSDVFVSLEDRVRIARRAGADLFIALHADSAGADTRAHGASVYTLSDHGETRVNEVLDGREWFRRAAAHGDPAVGGILLDLTQRSTLNRSSIFAQLLLDQLGDKVDLLPNSHRDAGYFVLLAPDVPAVLLEMGFITCPADEARLADPAQRRRLVDAVADAIDAYFAGEVRLAAN
jgi:N-acetylmuramoyl-L-alanine amidase